MSSRELWFCHECQEETRALRMPDPVCATCNGSFVEKIENPSDDPREFAQNAPGLGEDGLPQGMDTFLLTLQGLMDRGIAEERSQSPRRSMDGTGPGSRLSFQIRGGGNGERSFTLGGTNTLGGRRTEATPSGPGRPPTMSEFIRRGPEAPDGPTITGPIMAQYLMALLGHRDPFTEMFMRGMGDTTHAGPGRMGDYVFNQEALDQIITQLMENNNTGRPVPATDEIVEKLPREVLDIGSPTLEKDCAVCKEQFKLGTDDPDERVVVTLPCSHPFHEPCILPWLKSSGTCPVCRHALIPQPQHHPLPPSSGPGQDTSRPTSPSNRPRSVGSGGAEHSGLFHSLFGGYMGGRGGNSSGGNGNGASSQHHRSSSDPSRNSQGRPGNPDDHIPGSWTEDLD